jgi:fatty acid-binding protein DegV
MNGQLRWAKEVDDCVTGRLAAFYKEGDARKKKLVQLEQQYVARYRALQANVAKERTSCISLWKELQATEAEKQEADTEVYTLHLSSSRPSHT